MKLLLGLGLLLVTQTDPNLAPPKMNEVHKLKMQLLVAKKGELQAQYDRAMQALDVQLNTEAAAAYTDDKVDSKDWAIDPERGYVSRPKEKAPDGNP